MSVLQSGTGVSLDSWFGFLIRWFFPQPTKKMLLKHSGIVRGNSSRRQKAPPYFDRLKFEEDFAYSLVEPRKTKKSATRMAFQIDKMWEQHDRAEIIADMAAQQSAADCLNQEYEQV